MRFGPLYVYIYLYIRKLRERNLISIRLFAIRPWRAVSSLNFGIRSYGNVPMDRGIILCFRRKVGLTWYLPVRAHRFKKTPISIYMSICEDPL